MSNFYICNKELNNLKIKDKLHTHYYEPYSNLKLASKHVYYDEIVKDFKEDINSYGFSPFLHLFTTEQKKNEKIMKFKSKEFQNGYLNFIRSSNNQKVNKSIKEKGVQKNDLQNQRQVEKSNQIREDEREERNFLKSAIEKIQMNHKKKSTNNMINLNDNKKEENMKKIKEVNKDSIDGSINENEKNGNSPFKDNDFKLFSLQDDFFYKPNQNLIIKQASEKLAYKVPYSNSNNYQFYYGGRSNIKNYNRNKYLNIKGRCCLYKQFNEI